jgi:hypothetical protein
MVDTKPVRRFMEKVDVDCDAPCWRWTGAMSRGAYGAFHYRSRLAVAHRVAYEIFVGPIPVGLDIDHLCRNHWCVNPNHLEPVTRRINLLRGETRIAQNVAATHCPQGHEYSAANTRRETGGRRCRMCDRLRHRTKYRRENPDAPLRPWRHKALDV